MSELPNSVTIIFTRVNSNKPWVPTLTHASPEEIKKTLDRYRNVFHLQTKTHTFTRDGAIPQDFRGASLPTDDSLLEYSGLKLPPGITLLLNTEIHKINGRGWYFTRIEDRCVSQGFTTFGGAVQAATDNELTWG